MTDVINDFMGTPIEVGSMIVYATAAGSGSAKLTVAEVLEVKEPGQHGPRIKVQPMVDSSGYRWSTWGDDSDGKRRMGVKQPMAVTLQRITNVMVIT